MVALRLRSSDRTGRMRLSRHPALFPPGEAFSRKPPRPSSGNFRDDRLTIFGACCNTFWRLANRGENVFLAAWRMPRPTRATKSQYRRGFPNLFRGLSGLRRMAFDLPHTSWGRPKEIFQGGRFTLNDPETYSSDFVAGGT